MFKRRTMRHISVNDFMYDDVINYLGRLGITFSISKEYGPNDEDYYKFNHRDFDILMTDKEFDRFCSFMDTIVDYHNYIGTFSNKRES